MKETLKINPKFFCIINKEKPVLAGVVLSYLDHSIGYIPTFEFPFVSCEDFENDNSDNLESEHQPTWARARKLNIKVGNAIRKLGGCEYLILAGLNNKQKSYLKFSANYNIIDIDDLSNVDIFLNGIVPKKGRLLCKESSVIDYLPYALKENLYLSIDNNSDDITYPFTNLPRLVVIEKNNKVSSVIGVLYANLIGANVEMIDSKGLSAYEFKDLIENWRNDEPNSYNNLSAAIYPFIENIEFDSREFVTFFTDGVPYSLILENVVPISHVHLRINPDFFIFNNIYFETFSESYSALVFSPEEFEDEETDEVIKKLEKSNLYVKSLINSEATFYNLDNHVQHHPYSLLHICSHGGEVRGTRVVETIQDREGVIHKLEYDEVFSFGLNPHEDSHIVSTKRYPRKLNGFHWGGKELNSANYPSYVFADVRLKMGIEGEIISSTPIVVPGSSNIKCFDTNYPAMFHFLAASHSPIIFNNTCWSWSDIADSFIGVGARGYIGTLWDIDNRVALKSAEIFYDNIFDSTVLQALNKSKFVTQNSNNKDIYIFWGLHFSSLVKGPSMEFSRKVVLSKLLESISRWSDKLKVTKNTKSSKTILEIIKWIERTMKKDFESELKEYSTKKDEN